MRLAQFPGVPEDHPFMVVVVVVVLNTEVRMVLADRLFMAVLVAPEQQQEHLHLERSREAAAVETLAVRLAVPAGTVNAL